MRFALSLIMLFAVSCADEEIDAVENNPPVANAGFGQTIQRGQPFTFDGSASTDDDGEIVKYTWDFGDNVGFDGAIATHIYNNAGTFTVSLTVTDDDGATDTAQIDMTVIANEPPVAVIDAPSSTGIDQNVRFDGSQSTDADGVVSSWTWDFGDGTTGAGALVDHVYTEAGTYTVRLTCTDDKGATGEAIHVIDVEEGAAGYSGTWNWFLVDPNQRTLPGLCGTFEDSVLTILAVEPNMTITEEAGGVQVTYSGTISGADFDTTHQGSFGDSQRISGTFTSATAFEGIYAIDLSAFGESCDDRAVTGVKVSE
jgi:PKD repeat protein